ncbi:MAG: 1,2-phenylacetyl-CoA epoxidase subunit B, partial [Bacteroidota bacterium]
MKQFIKKFFYDDYDDKENAGGLPKNYDGVDNETGSWPLWEVFIRSKQGLDHKHAGSLHAADAKMAMENARDVYTRRQE